MRASILRFIAAVGGGAVAVASCSSAGRESGLDSRGRVALEVVLPAGVPLPTVAWKLEAQGVLARTGNLPVTAPGGRLSTIVTDLSPQNGYEASATAVATDGRTCSGRTTLDVIAGRTTAASVLLRCDQSGTLSATFNNCPIFTSISVSPLVTDVGGTIALRAAAFDMDCRDAQVGGCAGQTTIGWTASAGGIEPAGAASASYICPATGKHTLTVTASDGSCMVEEKVEVGCES